MSESYEKKLIDKARKQADAKLAPADVSSVGDFVDSLVLGEDSDSTVSNVFAEQIQPGTEISRYRIIEKIGEGGMGEVYLAQHVKFTKRLFAVKFLKRDLVTAEMKTRFEQEINAMEDLCHDNVIFAHDAGEFDGAAYLVMDYVEGISVKSLTKLSSKIEINLAAEIIRQAANGLQHAHEQNMVHRDIKPSNLMITRNGVVKILDMGLARITDDRASQLTGTQQILGTPDYMAPEQWQDTKSVDIRADIYSLGCTLYYLLAGHAPFDDEAHSSLATKLSGHLKDPPPKIEFDTADPRMESLQDVLGRMMEKNPEDRFQTPQEVAKALEEFSKDADLSSLSRHVVPKDVSKFDTRSIQDQLEDTQTRVNKSTVNTDESKDLDSVFRKTKFWFVGSAAAVFFILILSWPYIANLWKPSKEFAKNPNQSNVDNRNKTSKPTKSTGKEKVEIKNGGAIPNGLESNPFSITYISRTIPELGLGDEKQVPVDEGEIGDSAYTGRLGDGLKVKVDLPAAKYLFLVALNPTDDPKYRIQLCYPNSADATPERLSGLVYPESERKFFGMTDGIGQQAFVLIMSDDPLPNFEQWKQQHVTTEFPWRISEQTGVWATNDKGEIQRVIERGGLSVFRGDIIEIKSNVLERTVDFLKAKKFQVHTLAFPVLEK